MRQVRSRKHEKICLHEGYHPVVTAVLRLLGSTCRFSPASSFLRSSSPSHQATTMVARPLPIMLVSARHSLMNLSARVGEGLDFGDCTFVFHCGWGVLVVSLRYPTRVKTEASESDLAQDQQICTRALQESQLRCDKPLDV